MYAYIDHHMACHKYICIYDFFFSINRYFQKPKPLYVYIEVYLVLFILVVGIVYGTIT